MKVSRFLIVAALTASCSHETTSDRSDQKAPEPAPAVSTTGETTNSAPAPSAEIRASKLATTPIADEAKASNVNPDAAVNPLYAYYWSLNAQTTDEAKKIAYQKPAGSGHRPTRGS